MPPSAPIECLTREELLGRVQELQQGLVELSLKELAAHRESLTNLSLREEATRAHEAALEDARRGLHRREMEVAAREEEVARREAALASMEVAYNKPVYTSGAGTPDVAYKSKLFSPDPVRAQNSFTPTPTRSSVPSLFIPKGDTGSSNGRPTSYDRQDVDGCPAASSEAPWEEAMGQTFSAPVSRSPGVVPPERRRLSGVSHGSASKLKALFEKRGDPMQSLAPPAGRSHLPGFASAPPARVARRTAPPSLFQAAITPALNVQGPAPKISLQELLRQDEERRAENVA